MAFPFPLPLPSYVWAAVCCAFNSIHFGFSFRTNWTERNGSADETGDKNEHIGSSVCIAISSISRSLTFSLSDSLSLGCVVDSRCNVVWLSVALRQQTLKQTNSLSFLLGSQREQIPLDLVAILQPTIKWILNLLLPSSGLTFGPPIRLPDPSSCPCTHTQIQ